MVSSKSTILLRLTIWTLLSCRDDMEIIDVEGKTHPLPKFSVDWMIAAGWIFFFASFCFNGLYYKIHPSSTDISTRALFQRLTCQKEENEKTKKYDDDDDKHDIPEDHDTYLHDHDEPYGDVYRRYRAAGQISDTSCIYDQDGIINDYIGRRRWTLRSNGTLNDYIEDRDLFEYQYGYNAWMH